MSAMDKFLAVFTDVPFNHYEGPDKAAVMLRWRWFNWMVGEAYTLRGLKGSTALLRDRIGKPSYTIVARGLRVSVWDRTKESGYRVFASRRGAEIETVRGLTLDRTLSIYDGLAEELGARELGLMREGEPR